MAEQKVAGQIGFTSVILMILTSCLGIRGIPVADGIGTPALLFWLLGIMGFMIYARRDYVQKKNARV